VSNLPHRFFFIDRKSRIITLTIVGLGTLLLAWFSEVFAERIRKNSLDALYLAAELEENLALSSPEDQKAALRLIEEYGQAMNSRVRAGRALLPRAAERPGTVAVQTAKALGKTPWGSEEFKRTAVDAHRALFVAAETGFKTKRYLPFLPSPRIPTNESEQTAELLAAFHRALDILGSKRTVETASACYQRSRLAAAATFLSLPAAGDSRAGSLLGDLRGLAGELEKLEQSRQGHPDDTKQIAAWKLGTERRIGVIDATSTGNFDEARSLLGREK